MLINHTIPSLGASRGGPSHTVTALCDALAMDSSIRVVLTSQETSGDSPIAGDNPKVIRHVVAAANAFDGTLGLRPADRAAWRAGVGTFTSRARNTPWLLASKRDLEGESISCHL